MDIDPASLLPNELALSLADKCQKWTYATYSGEYEVNDVPRNPTVDRTYDARLDRAITDIQSKIQSQRRALDDVFPRSTQTYKQLLKKAQEEEEKQQASLQNLNPEAKVMFFRVCTNFSDFMN